MEDCLFAGVADTEADKAAETATNAATAFIVVAKSLEKGVTGGLSGREDVERGRTWPNGELKPQKSERLPEK